MTKEWAVLVSNTDGKAILDMNKVNVLVKIHIARERAIKKQSKLTEDYWRIKNTLTNHEYNEFIKRVN